MAYKFSIGARKLHGALDVNSSDASIDFKADEIDSTEIAELNNFDTDDLTEGGSNLYYSDARARDSVSATDAGGDGSFAYNSSTGVFTYTGPSSAEARAHISVADNGGDGSLSYNAGSGVISYTGPSAAEVRAHFSEDADILTLSAGVIGVDAALMTASVEDIANAHLSADGDLIDLDGNGALSTNATNFSASWDVKMAADDSDSLSEGSSNLYFTQGRARQSVSVTDAGGDGSLSYNNSTGVLTFTGPSAAEVRAHLSEDADILTYAAGTGIIGVDDAMMSASVQDILRDSSSQDEVRGHLSAGTGVNFASGEFSIGQAVATSDDVTFVTGSFTGDVTVSGDLTVNGDLVTLNTSELHVEDSLIRVANGASALAAGQGLEIGNDLASFKMDASDRWASSQDIDLASGKALYIAGNKILDATSLHSNVQIASANLGSVDTDDLSEGSSNLYYTDARTRAAVSVTDAGGDGSLSYNAGSGVITYTGPSAAEVRAHFSEDADILTLSAGVIGVDSAIMSASVQDIMRDSSSADEVRGHLSAGDGLDFASGEFSLDLKANDGLQITATELAVKVDDSSLEVDSSAGIQVKALGITDAMLAGSISFSKLSDSANIARLDQGETVAGDWSFAGDLALNAQMSVNVGDVTMSSNEYDVAAGDYFLVSSGHADGDNIVLPSTSANAGRVLIVKNMHASNGLDIVPDGSDTIDQAASISLDSVNAAVNLVSDGFGNWMIW